MGCAIVRYLLHSPDTIPTLRQLQDVWKGLEAARASGKAKSIGVSNMSHRQLASILDIATEAPVVNQLEYHPYQQHHHSYIRWMRDREIAVAAFNTLAPLTVAKGGPLDGLLYSIASSHAVSPAAVLLRWAAENDVVPITTTGCEIRMEGYLDAVDSDLRFSLTREEHDEINRVGRTHQLPLTPLVG